MEPDHKELLIGLLGSTYGELKRLDDSIVGSSNFLTTRRNEIKQELENVVKNTIASKPDVPILQAIQPSVPQPVFPQPVVFDNTPTQIAPTSNQLTQDPNQLELDLYKVTKYEDIINAIDKLYEKVNRLEDKIDTLIKNTNTPKKKAPGLVES